MKIRNLWFVKFKYPLLYFNTHTDNQLYKLTTCKQTNIFSRTKLVLVDYVVLER